MMPDTIHIILSKASDCHRPVPNLSVEARVDIDDELGARSSHETNRLFYESQARSLVSAFTRTLPGGLIDAILLALLEHRVGILRVPYSELESSRTSGGA